MTLLSSETPVQLALRVRPRLAEHLAAFGAEAWVRPQATLSELFRNRETLQQFLSMSADLPIPDARDAAPWPERPACHLADHLTQQHRDFFNLMIPDIKGIFRDWDSLDPEITELREDFDRYVTALRRETDQEELLFFPRVLRYDACLRDARVNPEFNGGSLRIAVAYRKSHAAGLQPDLVDRIAGRLRETHAWRDGNTWAELLAARLDDFRDHLAEHERLESEVLYPMALEMETTLYNLSIAGLGARTDAGVTVG